MARIDPLTNQPIGVSNTTNKVRIDPLTNQSVTPPKQPIFSGSKALEGAKAASVDVALDAWDSIKDLYGMARGKRRLSPTEVGDDIKNILTSPLYLATAPVSAPVSAVLSGFGATEAIGKGIGKAGQKIEDVTGGAITQRDVGLGIEALGA